MKNRYQLLLACCLCLAGTLSAQVPLLNSYPAASATLFIDFDGHYVKGTSWNSNGPLTLAPSGLTVSQMTEIFSRVAEDYRPFNINITTDSTRYWSAPQYQRMRLVLTTTSEWYGNAGGISFVGSFNWGDNTPAFVFTALLGFNTKNVAEATSHEAGHTLYLRHQSSYDGNCTKTAEYNSGNGSGEIGWAPIMGNGYYRNMTLWNNGANPYGCTSLQDDLGIITSYNGFSYRTDDLSNTPATATPTNFTNGQFTINGVIERNTDVDVIKFTLPEAGTLHLEGAPYSVASGYSGANLDLQMELSNADQSVVVSYNPDDLLQSVADTFLEAGTYYVSMKGRGNLYAPQYASLGSYTLQASFSGGGVLPLHRLELKGTREKNKHVLDWTLTADEPLVAQQLEWSSDGRTFVSVAAPSNELRHYAWLPSKQGLAYYRLKVVLSAGKTYYSNVVAIDQATGNRPAVSSTLIGSQVTIHAPEGWSYTVYDFNGRRIAGGALAPGLNTLSSDRWSAGIYLLRFVQADAQFTEKIIKR
ncbi:MAG TPA: T9SS type A sorting domain-containing protein [Flavisolibacter sp.]|jgi:hypothetical protein|nr:T9SS type A sorting domain-containing protein [Flavisolibacter sp.]